ncbi:MAG: HPr family phosphocarrier protein [Verrucomicrobia bacterium]|nr:HPr family phosphocarrier protein [Verrucomicrobiota bacterium]MBU4427805.1 HPr family phosphocarrier protein [Verrucomicrobiota bacterium]MCG2681368.1 HPr family phosphocarrier protein [Kiritimatiellia bacterium]
MSIKEINLTPAELNAILDHKRVMSEKQGKEVTIEQAIEHFILHFRADWRQEKQHRDTQTQREEIEKHKYFRSKDEGRDIGKAMAAEEWCAKYAHIWRAERESLERNGFIKVDVVIQSENGLHIEPASRMAVLASKFDCEVYLHRDNMDYYNFILQGKKYLNVKSILGLLSVAAWKGESLELIATGPEARPALDAVIGLINT